MTPQGKTEPARTVIVVPCHNEESRLPVEEFKRFAAEDRSIRFLMVDDGSSDKTFELMENLRRSDPAVFDIHRLKENRGKAEAVRQGFLEAFKSQPEFVGFWDADLATPLRVIHEFRGILEEKSDVKVVFGSRVMLLGRTIVRRPFRHLAGRIFMTVADSLIGIHVYDTQCGAKLFRMSPSIASVFSEPFLTKWIFDVEIVARLDQDSRMKNSPPVESVIYEQPVAEWRDKPGSKLGALGFITAAIDLLRIYRRYMNK